MTEASPGRRATSVDHVLDVLLAFRSGRPRSVTELSRQLDLPPSSVYRALVTLHEGGYLYREPGATAYQVGPRVHELIDAVFGRFAIRDTSLPYLHQLAADIGETVALSVPVGWYSVRIAVVEGWRELTYSLPLGETWPLHIGASGRAILAFMSDEEIERYLDERDFRKYTHRTARNVRQVWSDITLTRSQGYVLGRGEVYLEARSIAFPISNRGNRSIAAVTVSGPAVQFDPNPDGALVKRCEVVVSELQAAVMASSSDFEEPYSHIDPEALASRVMPPRSVPADTDDG